MFRIVVSGTGKKGDRNHFEDLTLGKFEENDIFLAVFDGHCGREAAVYARDNLWDNIKSMKEFYSDKLEEIVEAIKKGFKKTQEEMLALWKEECKHINSGTTVACVLIRGGLMFAAGVGDSAVILGKVDPVEGIIGEMVTAFHRPNVKEESDRIISSGGKVQKIDQVLRVIYERDDGLQNPKLNLTRGLGHSWSFIDDDKGYLISPIPDVFVRCLYPTVHKYIILATDGVLDVMDANSCVRMIHDLSGGYIETSSEAYKLSEQVLDTALQAWRDNKKTADDVSIVTAFLKSNVINVNYDVKYCD